MPKLNLNAIKANEWNGIGVKMPEFCIESMKKRTKDTPKWVHFGAGNIFRGYIARLHNELLNKNLTEEGIIACETFDFEIIDKIYEPYDNLTLLVTLKHDGVIEKEVIASLAEGLRADTGKNELIKAFENPSLQMASYTITEKGYSLFNINGEILPIVENELKNEPSKAVHAISVTCYLMLCRFLKGAYPISLVSMDNCSHNGTLLKEAVCYIAEGWIKNGFAPKEFLDYLGDSSKVGFPWSMIDKITPRPSETVQNELSKDGIEDMQPVITSKNTFIAPFVNAEEAEYLVIEDIFPNGRPPLEAAGVYFTDRDTVNSVETMKVTTCLNPLHTALAPLGCLLGYDLVYKIMKDDVISKLVKKIGYDEGMKVVVNPGIINPKDFIDEVVYKRLPNPFIPDTPQRISTDTSQKLAIRFGVTIKSYMASKELDSGDLVGIPLAIAGWLRYLLAADDNLNPMPLNPDPLLDSLTAALANIKPGDPSSYNGELAPILSNKSLFGVDLYEANLGKKIEAYFIEMLAGKNAIRKTLEKYV